MRAAIILFLFLSTSNAFSQKSSVISIKLNQIEQIPCTYVKKSPGSQFYDKAFKYILAQDTFAIPSLIDLLTDTSKSKVKDPHTKTFYKKGDLAFILINYIEWVPFALITHSQWCICCDCGDLPTGFLEYLNNNRFEFQKKYRSYYTSKERKKIIK